MTAKPGSRPLPGLPKDSLSAQQQLDALRCVQNQAEQRVKLGMQLFKAAEARTSQYQAMLDQMKADQEALRTRMSQDMARSFQVYDKWVGQIDKTVTNTLGELEARIENRYASVRREVVWDPLLHRVESVLCDACKLPTYRLHLCANGHLACDDCVLHCSACKREFCRLCEADMGACAVCNRPLCVYSQIRCKTCGQVTCQEHQGQCH